VLQLAAPDSRIMSDQEGPLTPLDRLRRTFITAHSALKNLAYYRAARQSTKRGNSIHQGDVDIRIVNNFLDIGVLDWCKLFVRDERHAWNRIIPHDKRDQFLTELLAQLRIDWAVWDAYIEKCRTYRDKFLAHLDSKRTMYPPELDLAIEATVFLGRFLQAHHPEANNIPAHEMDLRVSLDDAALAGKAYFA
jgi:hypothetical protein